MPTLPPFNINQFQQAPVIGQVDLQITRSGVITGMLSANQSGSVVAGQAVKLDPAITEGFNPQFLSVADNADCIGIILRTVKAASFSALDEVEVAYFGGPVIWECAGATLTPGAQVEFATSGGVPFAQPLASGKIRGVALDPATINQLFRMIQLGGLLVP